MDYSIFVSYNKSKFIQVYMDNFLIISKDLNIINSLKNKLLKDFFMTYLELIFNYLGMYIT